VILAEEHHEAWLSNQAGKEVWFPSLLKHWAEGPGGCGVSMLQASDFYFVNDIRSRRGRALLADLSGNTGGERGAGWHRRRESRGNFWG
jgi:hypothetical protein